MKESTIEITLQVNDAGLTETVSVQSDATARDRVLAAMYLLEDAFKTGRECATDDEPNPIATLIGDSFNAHCVLDALSDLSRKVEKNDEKISEMSERRIQVHDRYHNGCVPKERLSKKTKIRKEKRSMESIESIARWHRETFPDATVLSQHKKFQEELKEWHESQHITDQGLILGDITELADMFIVACGLPRFNNVDALFAFRTVSVELSHSMYPTIDLEIAIMKKMKTNRARKWDNNNGLYRHKED